MVCLSDLPKSELTPAADRVGRVEYLSDEIVHVHFAVPLEALRTAESALGEKLGHVGVQPGWNIDCYFWHWSGRVDGCLRCLPIAAGIPIERGR